MRKYMVLTPENIEVEYTLADLGSRMAAAVIDTTLQMIFYTVELGVVALIAQYAPAFLEKYSGWILGIVLLLTFIFQLGYYIISEATMNGMTYGKKMMKIRVIRMNGQPITLKHAAIRNVIKLFIDMQGVGIVLIFFNKHSRRLGDFAASTVVVTEAYAVKPASLEQLTSKMQKINYYLNDEEQQILRSWLERKNSIRDAGSFRDGFKKHLTEKFEKLELLNEMRDIIEQI